MPPNIEPAAPTAPPATINAETGSHISGLMLRLEDYAADQCRQRLVRRHLDLAGRSPRAFDVGALDSGEQFDRLAGHRVAVMGVDFEAGEARHPHLQRAGGEQIDED